MTNGVEKAVVSIPLGIRRHILSRVILPLWFLILVPVSLIAPRTAIKCMPISRAGTWSVKDGGLSLRVGP